MKVLIVSDSHGLTKELTEIKAKHENEVDVMIHCGDSELKSDSNEMSGFLKVQGNCDLDAAYPEEEERTINGIHFFITHGHKYGVKMSPINLIYRAKEKGASIACFGHSHVAIAEYANDVLIINPGSIKQPRIRVEKTYVILEITEKNKAIVRYFDLFGKELKDLKYECQIG